MQSSRSPPTPTTTMRFGITRLEERIAPRIAGVKRNGGGSTPNGESHGVPTVNINPSGHAPGGHN